MKLKNYLDLYLLKKTLKVLHILDKPYMLNKVVVGIENWVFAWDYCNKSNCLRTLQEAKKCLPLCLGFFLQGADICGHWTQMV